MGVASEAQTRYGHQPRPSLLISRDHSIVKENWSLSRSAPSMAGKVLAVKNALDNVAKIVLYHGELNGDQSQRAFLREASQMVHHYVCHSL